ncbi:MAG TPA: hypothetical protein VHA06_18000, partial [Candidatus Angelobacter sp.]|nr:hypothetical protein [Candidatus Angelobacter sp.]
FPVDWWRAQNLYYAIFRNNFSEITSRQDSDSRDWQERFLALGEKLKISVPKYEPAELQLAG